MMSSIWRKSTYCSTSCGECLEASFQKSSYSQGNGNCLEAALPDGTVLVRDSKNVDGGVLEFSPRSWNDFLYAIKNNEF